MSISIQAKVNTRALGAALKIATKDVLDDADKKLGVSMTVANRETIRGWPVDTGSSRASITGPERVEQGVWRFRILSNYARVIEYGGYRGVGPKTAQQGGTTLPGGIEINEGIYAIQRPSAPMRRGMAKGMAKFKELTG